MRRSGRTRVVLIVPVLLVACEGEVTKPGLDAEGAAPAFAITVNDDGTGFVGKGDVQYTLGWNNAQLQANADKVRFKVMRVVVTERSWECTHSVTGQVREREQRTRATTRGLLSSVGRLKNQITGFNLLGFDGDPTTTENTTGQPLNQCPGPQWSLSSPAGDPELVSDRTNVEVSGDGGATWTELLAKP